MLESQLKTTYRSLCSMFTIGGLFVFVFFSVMVKSLGPTVRLSSDPDSAFTSCVFLSKVLNLLCMSVSLSVN